MEGALATLPRLQFSGLVQEAARFIESFAAQTRAIEELAAQTRATDEAFAAQQSPLTTIATDGAHRRAVLHPPPWPLTASPQQFQDLPALRAITPVADRCPSGSPRNWPDGSRHPRRLRPKPRLETRGRSREWAYEEAGLAVLSAILRGKTAKPTTEAEVKRLLRDWLQERYADEPADSKCASTPSCS